MLTCNYGKSKRRTRGNKEEHLCISAEVKPDNPIRTSKPRNREDIRKLVGIEVSIRPCYASFPHCSIVCVKPCGYDAAHAFLKQHGRA